MFTSSVDGFIAANSNSLPSTELAMLRYRLHLLPEHQQYALLTVPMKSPVITLVLAIFLGWTGLDKFYIGDVGTGIAKLFFFNLSSFLLLPAVFVSYGSEASMIAGSIGIMLTAILCLFLLLIWYWIDVFTSFGATKRSNLQRIYKNILLLAQ
ncbi:TM2 domain-containing protein [Streptococcus suis]|nr:TM2 domain-containing protein [Streptococcus suis]NQO83831.1 TM2 domain-containing protein [Streptococcus suis]HEM5489525.1 TM2 domain-containing protein [Streptococcus suis]